MSLQVQFILACLGVFLGLCFALLGGPITGLILVCGCTFWAVRVARNPDWDPPSIR